MSTSSFMTEDFAGAMTEGGAYLQAQSYLELPCSNEDLGNVKKLLIDLSKYAVQIAANFKSILALGASIKHLHPLKFVAAIVLDEENRLRAKGIHDYAFAHKFKGAVQRRIWNQLTRGIELGLKNHDQHNNLLQYLPSFAAQMHCDVESLFRAREVSIQEGSWEPLLIAMNPIFRPSEEKKTK
ncbi:MAG: hypothetical protein WCP39_04460 [Chlamydiota bacterium]